MYNAECVTVMHGIQQLRDTYQQVDRIVNDGVNNKQQYVTQAASYLKHISASFFLTQTAVTANVLTHGLVWAQFHKNVHVLAVLEKEVKSHNPLMIKCAMYFYLCLKLWLGGMLACSTQTTWSG